ncbi:MAG TPA: thioredoxin domain-containing protein [Polyangia bacterium]|jgi:protein-disulfide isomerase|nr:thioredoxin domain-containing protein [Polyangia bacterium]
MAHENDPRPAAWTAAIWPLVTGLAVGFLVGRETGSHGASSVAAETVTDKPSDVVPAGTKMPAKIYHSESEFPAGWTKEADLASVTAVSFAGLTAQQKVTALQALNERDCECGCGMGKIAGCLKKDPNCPRSPNLARVTIDMAKQGKGLGEILAAIDDKQKPTGGSAPSGGAAPEGGSRKIVPFAHDLRRGAKATKVTMVEFSDFQCPFCKRAEPTVKTVLDKYGKDLALVWMNQPLPFHDHAMDAATAFQAAARQGADKAWKLHDKMYENNTALTRADIEKYAGDVGLNVAKWKKDWDDPKVKDEISEDMKTGTAAGANGTPTFFINGRQLVGAQEASAFEKIIDDEIKEADALLKKGTPLRDVYTKRIETASLAPPPAPAGAPDDQGGKFDVHVGDAPVKGPASAPVTLVAWSDFQCPFCSRAVPTVRQLETDYKGKLRIAFKQFPLPFHDKAHLAAEAALAANEQGKFWQMHDKMFANQQALDRPSLEKYAQEIGLDMTKFKAALDSGKFKDKVDAEDKEGAAFGVTGTPTFFVNGTRLVGAQPLEAFKAVIDKELKGSKG